MGYSTHYKNEQIIVVRDHLLCDWYHCTDFHGKLQWSFPTRKSMKTGVLFAVFLGKTKENKKGKQLFQDTIKFTASFENCLPLVNLLLTGIG